MQTSTRASSISYKTLRMH